MKKIIFLLLSLPLCAFAADKNSLTVETAFKNAANFGKTDAMYHVVKYYVSGVLKAHVESKPMFVVSKEQKYKLLPPLYTEEIPEIIKYLQENEIFLTSQDKKNETISCILEQDPDIIMKKIFYKYIDGKIDGKADMAKQVIETANVYCREKLSPPPKE